MQFASTACSSQAIVFCLSEVTRMIFAFVLVNAA